MDNYRMYGAIACRGTASVTFAYKPKYIYCCARRGIGDRIIGVNILLAMALGRGTAG